MVFINRGNIFPRLRICHQKADGRIKTKTFIFLLISCLVASQSGAPAEVYQGICFCPLVAKELDYPLNYLLFYYQKLHQFFNPVDIFAMI